MKIFPSNALCPCLSIAGTTCLASVIICISARVDSKSYWLRPRSQGLDVNYRLYIIHLRKKIPGLGDDVRICKARPKELYIADIISSSSLAYPLYCTVSHYSGSYWDLLSFCIDVHLVQIIPPVRKFVVESTLAGDFVKWGYGDSGMQIGVFPICGGQNIRFPSGKPVLDRSMSYILSPIPWIIDSPTNNLRDHVRVNSYSLNARHLRKFSRRPV